MEALQRPSAGAARLRMLASVACAFPARPCALSTVEMLHRPACGVQPRDNEYSSVRCAGPSAGAKPSCSPTMTTQSLDGSVAGSLPTIKLMLSVPRVSHKQRFLMALCSHAQDDLRTTSWWWTRGVKMRRIADGSHVCQMGRIADESHGKWVAVACRK